MSTDTVKVRFESHTNRDLHWWAYVTYTHAHFEWPWVILSKLAKYSMTRSIAQSLIDSWDSCFLHILITRKATHHCSNSFLSEMEISALAFWRVVFLRVQLLGYCRWRQTIKVGTKNIPVPLHWPTLNNTVCRATQSTVTLWKKGCIVSGDSYRPARSRQTSKLFTSL